MTLHGDAAAGPSVGAAAVAGVLLPAAPLRGAALEMDGVSVRFGSVQALDGVTLRVPAGSLTAVLGPSGCGKTTLLRVLAGFVWPDRGEVRVGDALVTGGARAVPAQRRGVAVVPQEGALFPHLNVAGNVGYGLPRRGAGRRRRIDELLELVGLGGLGSRRPDELSGGQQQRVALARALAPKPAAVVLDEPFSALDAGLRAVLRADVRQALRACGTTALLVTHDQQEALSIADAVAVMHAGRLLMHGTPAEIYSAPTDLRVARFVGELVELAAERRGATLHCALGALASRETDRAAAAPDGPVLACLRPEQLLLTAPAHGPVAVVQDIAFHGHDWLVRLRLLDPAGTPLFSRVRTPVVVGQRVGVQVEGPVLCFQQGLHGSSAG